MMSHYIIKIQNQVAMNHMKLSPLNHQREYKLHSIKYRVSMHFNKLNFLYKQDFIIIFILLIMKTRVKFSGHKSEGLMLPA